MQLWKRLHLFSVSIFRVPYYFWCLATVHFIINKCLIFQTWSVRVGWGQSSLLNLLNNHCKNFLRISSNFQSAKRQRELEKERVIYTGLLPLSLSLSLRLLLHVMAQLVTLFSRPFLLFSVRSLKRFTISPFFHQSCLASGDAITSLSILAYCKVKICT